MQSRTRFDVAIVGGGPAGLGAALVLGRGRRRVLVLDDERPRNVGTKAVHGYLTRDGTAPEDLRSMGRRELRRYDVEVRTARVDTIVRAAPERVHAFEVHAGELVVHARKVLLATGLSDHVPELPGLRDLYGTSVHQCPFCDGWEERDGQLACYGSGDGAATAALCLRAWSHDVALFTDGNPGPGAEARAALDAAGIECIETAIARLEGGAGRLERVVLDDGREIRRSAMFLHLGQKPQSGFAAALGCRLDANGVHVEVDADGRTSAAGVFAAGDVIAGSAKMAIVAAGQGASAARALVTELLAEDRALERRAVRHAAEPR